MSCKRQRTDNFSSEEKELLIDLIKEHTVIESKETDPKILKKKHKTWENISETFKARGYERETKSLKKLYFRLKQNAKERISRYRREQKKTGGGTSSVSEPSDIDWAISDVCPVDFNDDVSEFDSDGKCDFQAILPENQSETIGLIDPMTGVIQIFDETPLSESTTIQPLPEPIVPPPIDSTHSTSNNCGKKNKKHSQMNAYELEIIEMNRRHIESKMENERKLHEKEMEILDFKLEYRKLKLAMLKSSKSDKST